MFKFLRKGNKNDTKPDMRALLFGDVPLDQWAQGDGEPWNRFRWANTQISAGRTESAIELLYSITSMNDLDPRHYLQAWHSLRKLGMSPDESVAKMVYGVVIEVDMPDGVQILAVYNNRSACYLNHSGATLIWDQSEESMDNLIDLVMSMSQVVVNIIGPWEGERPDPPGRGRVRVNFLTPSGLHFGEGPFGDLFDDGLAGPVFARGTLIMSRLMELAKK